MFRVLNNECWTRQLFKIINLLEISVLKAIISISIARLSCTMIRTMLTPQDKDNYLYCVATLPNKDLPIFQYARVASVVRISNCRCHLCSVIAVRLRVSLQGCALSDLSIHHGDTKQRPLSVSEYHPCSGHGCEVIWTDSAILKSPKL